MKKIFILFGASGDLGKEAANYFLNEEYDHYYFLSRKELLIENENKNCTFIKIEDATDERFVKEVFSKIVKDTSAQYFLFNTIGGYSGGKKIFETEVAEVKKMYELNFISSFLIAKHFMKLIEGTNGGVICFTGAYSSLVNEMGKLAYGVSKSGLNYLAKTLSVEGNAINLYASVVAPFIIDTDSNREWVEDKSILISPKQICEQVSNIFMNPTVHSGKIFPLKK